MKHSFCCVLKLVLNLLEIKIRQKIETNIQQSVSKKTKKKDIGKIYYNMEMNEEKLNEII